MSTSQPRRTPLYERHVSLGAKIVDFAGWGMPIQYAGGIVEEHLATRRRAGLFDVSHMGRFRIRGPEAAVLLDRALTNDAGSLAVGRAQYTLIPTDGGGAVDDAFLYRLERELYLLVVNAANRDRDWQALASAARGLSAVRLEDASEELAMISIQGPDSPQLLGRAWGAALPGELRTAERNTILEATVEGVPLLAARTGYAGEPLGYELLMPAGQAGAHWDRLVAAGATPVGLGARDTLRLEAGLPLYGHELGTDPEGGEIPIYACPQARLGVRLSVRKVEMCGRVALERQAAAWRRLRAGDAGGAEVLRRLVRQMTLTEPGVARAGCRILDASGKQTIGWVTSGTVVPTWIFAGPEGQEAPTDNSRRRSALLGLVDATVPVGSPVKVEVRGRPVGAVLVPRLLDTGSLPYARPAGA